MMPFRRQPTYLCEHSCTCIYPVHDSTHVQTDIRRCTQVFVGCMAKCPSPHLSTEIYVFIDVYVCGVRVCVYTCVVYESVCMQT
jgi:hypothetical protein